MNQEKINRNLREQDSDSSEFQKAVVEYVRKLMKASAAKMSTYHGQWDTNSYLYRGYRSLDKEDVASIRDGEPTKILVPISYAQCQTALSFILSTYTQRDNLLELRGRGPEDEKGSMALTTDLSYQLEHEKFVLKLYFWLLDALKQGFGVVRVEWDECYYPMRVAKQTPDYSIGSMFGAMFGKEIPTKTEEAVEEVLSYQGNQIRNISPYAFYPDPAVNIGNFQDGMFVAHEEEVAFVALEAKEGEMYFGTDKVPKSMSKELYKERSRRVSGPFNEENSGNDALLEKSDKANLAIRTEIEITLSEKEASKLWKSNFGTGTKPVKWLITIINDQKVVRFEKRGNLHGRFSYEVFEFSPDHDSFFNPGLVSTVSELQGLITFFLNSHVLNVKKIIANRFVVDPTKVEMDDIKSGSIYIRTKGAQGDISRVIKQLETSDITRSHITDMEVLMSLVQTVTGVNENALGQYSAGRRSATEARNVNAGAAARLKMHATLAWLQGILPLGQQLLANTRQWRTANVYANIVGAMVEEAPFETTILANPEKIAGGYDFVPYDATLPTDRQFQAGVLQELFGLLVSNPNTIQLVNKDPMKLLNYIAQLYNIRNLRDFDLSTLPVTQVVPDQQAADAAEAGAEQVDIGGESILEGLRQ